MTSRGQSPATPSTSAAVTSVQRSGPSVYRVPAGEAGFYAIGDSYVQVNATQKQELQLRVDVQEGTAAPAVLTSLAAGEPFEFDVFLGYVEAGERIRVALLKDGAEALQSAAMDYKVTRMPAIPVTEFPADLLKPETLQTPAQWSVMDVPAGLPGARLAGWVDGDAGKLVTPAGNKAQIRLGGDADREIIAAFRVAHSGYYALHDATATVSSGRGAEARIYAGRSAQLPRKVVQLPAALETSLNSAIGYLEKGDVVYVAFVAKTPAEVSFSGSIIEWAPRRAPLRVRRGADGYLDVYEPAQPRLAVDVPAEKWVSVAAMEGDATDALRKAIEQARALQQGGYAGIRLESGKRYLLGSAQTGGVLFDIRDLNRFVFDGNGATLAVASPDSQRTGLYLFSTTASRNIVFADMTVESVTPPPYTLGEVVSVGPMQKGNQTVTFRLLPGMPDPLADIARTGMGSGYAYDSAVPGRVQEGAWGFYPGGVDVTPQLRAGKEPGLFEHTVTRTSESIRPGSKWLIKNKKAGVWYLVTRTGAEDITLSGISARACGGGFLRFWNNSGVNILNCRYEPIGDNWIGSSTDGVHGRGREGVWVEDTLLRGICEDIMNTYGLSMVVVPDDNAADAVMSLRMYSRERGAAAIPGGDSVLVGDQLVFFNPRLGKVLGYASVLAIADGRFTLSRAIAGIDTWDKDDGRGCTMIYNARLAARFFVRDSQFMDSLRFGAFIKAREGVIFNSRFEGLADSAIYAANEPEWPEGPPPSYLWIQGNTFSQNTRSFASRYRKHLSVDPADISIYTRRLRNPDEADTFRAYITRDQYPNSHMKIIGNTFHEWQGMGIAVRNSRNVQIADNVFLPPHEDATMRATLARDPAMARDGRGRYAGIFLDDIGGAQITGNRFYGLPAGDLTIARDQAVRDVVEADNTTSPLQLSGQTIMLDFAEWSGASSSEGAGIGAARDQVEIRGALRQVGRIGAGLFFNGRDNLAILKASPDASGQAAALSCGLWVRPQSPSVSPQVIYAQGDEQRGMILAIDKGRFVGGMWQGPQGAWLDLGPAVAGLWQHILVVWSGDAATLRGYVDGLPAAAAAFPVKLDAIVTDATFGGLAAPARLSARQLLNAGSAFYHGDLDEFCRFDRALTDAEASLLAMRSPAAFSRVPQPK